MIGAGVGGTSAFYAATLERPERHDLDETDARHHPHPTGGWPVGYDAFRPWFELAEELSHQRRGSIRWRPRASILLPPIRPAGLGRRR